MYQSAVRRVSAAARRISLAGALTASSLLLVIAVPGAASAATWHIITNEWGNITATFGDNVVYGSYAPPSPRVYVCVTVGSVSGIGKGGWHIGLINRNDKVLYEGPAWHQPATLCSPAYKGNPGVQGFVDVDAWISTKDIIMKLHVES
jgi:hypothetical protein